MSTVEPPPPPPPVVAVVGGGVAAAVVSLLSPPPPQAARPKAATAATHATAEARLIEATFRSSAVRPLYYGFLRPAARHPDPPEPSARSQLVAAELGLLALEEGSHAAPQVLGPHAVGDPVPLELQMVMEGVLDRLMQQPLGHPHVVGRLGSQLLRLLPGTGEQLVG